MGKYLGQAIVTIYDMLEVVRERPGMWIGNAEVERLTEELLSRLDVLVDPQENCYPMIPSGAAHDQMILSDVEKEPEVSDEGKMMV